MTKSREIMIAELGRRHPAAADDVDAILAMPRSDAVNDGLLACPFCGLALMERRNRPNPYAQCITEGCFAARGPVINLDSTEAVTAWNTRAVPSPDTVGVREAIESYDTYPTNAWANLPKRARDLIEIFRAAALAPSRREEIAHALNEWADLASNAIQWFKNIKTGISTPDEALTEMWANYERVLGLSRLALSEQSGPTAGREEPPAGYSRLPDGVVCKCFKMWRGADGSHWCCLPSSSPPDRQQDQDESSVVARGDEPITTEQLDVLQFGRVLHERPTKENIMTDDQIKHMVDRFLRWKLPESFNPDGGISFQRLGNEGTPHQYRREPSGTNLFDAAQADAMVRYMVEGLLASPPVSDASREALETALQEIVLTIAFLNRDLGSYRMKSTVEDLSRRLRRADEKIRAALNNSFDKTGGGA